MSHGFSVFLWFEHPNKYKINVLSFKCDTMHPSIKILIGALLIALGVFSTITFYEQLLLITQGAIGPLLIIIGAFIVWLESDEWKLRKQADQDAQQQDKNFNVQKSLSPKEEKQKQQKEQGNKKTRRETQTETAKYIQALEGTVKEAKKNIREMENPNYEKILDLEVRGKDRKTIKDFLQRKIEN